MTRLCWVSGDWTTTHDGHRSSCNSFGSLLLVLLLRSGCFPASTRERATASCYRVGGLLGMRYYGSGRMVAAREIASGPCWVSSSRGSLESQRLATE